MKKRISFICLLIVCMLLSACSYDNFLNNIQKMTDNMYYSKNFKTHILVTFDSENDIEAFEKRLDVLDLSIAEKSEESGKIKYKLTSHYNIGSFVFDELALAKTRAVVLVDSKGNVVLSEGVSVFEFRGSMGIIEVPNEIFEKYEFHKIINFDFKIDETVYDTIFGTRKINDKEYIDFQEHPKSSDTQKLVQAMLGFSGIEMENDVKIEVVN